MEEKLADLEIRLSFQDQEIQTLNDVIIRQQQQIDSLVEQVKHLQEKLRELTPSQVIPLSEEKPPPHY